MSLSYIYYLAFLQSPLSLLEMLILNNEANFQKFLLFISFFPKILSGIFPQLFFPMYSFKSCLTFSLILNQQANTRLDTKGVFGWKMPVIYW